MILTMSFYLHFDKVVILLFMDVMYVMILFWDVIQDSCFRFWFVMVMAGCLKRIILLAGGVSFWVLGSIILQHFRNALIFILF